jgi:hypothetical protein
MNQSERLLSNEFIVDERIIHEYIQKKDELMKERNCRTWKGIIYTLFITFLYYADIITDLRLCAKYYLDGDIWWSGITLGIVVFSSLLNTFILFKYSYFQDFKFNWKKKQYFRIVLKSLILIFQLELLCW